MRGSFAEAYEIDLHGLVIGAFDGGKRYSLCCVLFDACIMYWLGAYRGLPDLLYSAAIIGASL